MSAQSTHASAHSEGSLHTGGHHEHEDHVLPMKMYFAVYGILMVLTVLTVGVSYADLGAASLMTAMVVAVIKAAMVAGYFMHLKWDERFHSLVFFASILFLAIMFVLTLVDLNSRGMMLHEQDNQVLRDDQSALQRMEEQAAAQPAAAQPAAAQPGASQPAAAQPAAVAPVEAAPAADMAPAGEPRPATRDGAVENGPTGVSPTPSPNP